MSQLPYERPIRSRYLDALELIWLSTARRLGLTLRRDPSIFSRTDGSGHLWLGPRADLDPDDTLCQMLLHELCHWITNGIETFHEQDWGFPLMDGDDPREFSSLRLQAWLADQHGLRGMLGPTGKYREYFDRIGADPLAPLDDSPGEAHIVAVAREAIVRSQGAPFQPALGQALTATAALRDLLLPFDVDHLADDDDEGLPSLWTR
jgi:hypothetical protein